MKHHFELMDRVHKFILNGPTISEKACIADYLCSRKDDKEAANKIFTLIGWWFLGNNNRHNNSEPIVTLEEFMLFSDLWNKLLE